MTDNMKKSIDVISADDEMVNIAGGGADARYGSKRSIFDMEVDVMTDNMKKFMEAISADKELADKVAKMDRAAIAAEAEKLGIELTEADFASGENGQLPQGELSEDELFEVAGGACDCFLGGMGMPNEHTYSCNCNMEGNGRFLDDVRRCVCAIYGHGVDD